MTRIYPDDAFSMRQSVYNKYKECLHTTKFPKRIKIMNKSHFKNIALFLLGVGILIFVNLIKRDLIPLPKFINGPISFLFIIVLAGIMIWWGLFDLNKLKLKNKHKKKKEKKLFGVFSKTPTDPMVSFSYGQIIGGIMMIGFIIFWIIKYGFNFN